MFSVKFIGFVVFSQILKCEGYGYQPYPGYYPTGYPMGNPYMGYYPNGPQYNPYAQMPNPYMGYPHNVDFIDLPSSREVEDNTEETKVEATTEAKEFVISEGINPDLAEKTGAMPIESTAKIASPTPGINTPTQKTVENAVGINYRGMPTSHNIMYGGYPQNGMPYGGMPYGQMGYGAMPFGGMPYGGMSPNGMPYSPMYRPMQFNGPTARNQPFGRPLLDPSQPPYPYNPPSTFKVIKQETVKPIKDVVTGPVHTSTLTVAEPSKTVITRTIDSKTGEVVVGVTDEKGNDKTGVESNNIPTTTTVLSNPETTTAKVGVTTKRMKTFRARS